MASHLGSHTIAQAVGGVPDVGSHHPPVVTFLGCDDEPWRVSVVSIDG
jgi:hypothetical protein